jgi:phenylpyruvate tautomerase PptA (4-oxalocrotonate tautomerase family)
MKVGMDLRAILMFLLMPVASAELPPSAYEAMQAKAPEYLRIEVLRVNVEPGESPTQKKVHLIALTTAVVRTTSGLKPNEIVNIYYTVTEHPQGWAGPGEIPIPREKDQSVAYLKKAEGGDFAPAAGRMSFSNF